VRAMAEADVGARSSQEADEGAHCCLTCQLDLGSVDPSGGDVPSGGGGGKCKLPCLLLPGHRANLRNNPESLSRTQESGRSVFFSQQL
jgi:hypothetical protein